MATDVAVILAEVVPAAEEDKTEGNRLFQEGNYLDSAKAFKRGASLFDDVPAEDLTPDARKLLVALFCNAAQALLKCSNADAAVALDARAMADKAIALDPTNVKAVFRRGSANVNVEDWQAAALDFESVLELQPGLAAAEQELQKARAKLAEQKTEVSTEAESGTCVASSNHEIPADDVPASDATSLPRMAEEDEARDQGESQTTPGQPEVPLDFETAKKEAVQAVSMATDQAARLKCSVTEAAALKGCSLGWQARLETVQSSTEAWVDHQLSDPEVVKDLIALRGPVFGAMSLKQKREFMVAFDFVEDLRAEHGEALMDLLQDAPVVLATSSESAAETARKKLSEA